MSVPIIAPTRARHLWGEVWRTVAAASVGGLLLAAMRPGNVEGYLPGQHWVIPDLILGLISLVLLHFRRRWPVPIAVAAVLLTPFSASATGAAGIVVISMCTRRDWRSISLISVLWFITGAAFEVMHPSQHEGWGDVVTNVLVGVLSLGFCVATGLAIGSRRELVAGLRSRLEDAHREQALRADQARVAERARIAREMHDVLAHRISLVAMHSGALAYRRDLTSEEVHSSSVIIRDNANLALTELREVLGVLRESPADTEPEAPRSPEAPQPTLCDLPALVEDARATDGPIALTMPAPVPPLSDLVSRNAFRIIQEAITNRRKHAPQSPLTIRIGYDERRLTLEVTNSLATAAGPVTLPASGLGLVGITERAQLSGGELTAGVDRGSRFVVRAWLPLSRDD